MIEEELLQQYGAERRTYAKSEVLFEEGQEARFYHQVIRGELKMCNYSEEGKEFLQGVFSEGRSFGEPPLFGDFPYPAHAVALKKCEVWRLPREKFFQLLEEHPQVHFAVSKELATRLHYKAMMAREMSHEKAAHRITTLLEYLKTEVYQLSGRYTYEVELTRQQIANLTGLRVETVIRALKKLEEQEVIQIGHGKILM